MDEDRDTSNLEDSSESAGSGGRNRRYSNTSRLGVWNGWPIHIRVSQEPADADIPDDFGVNLFVTTVAGENVDIARIDTAHMGCHFDRFYLPKGKSERTRDYTVQYEDPDEAVLHFLRRGRWKYYVERYHENHGLPSEARVYD